MTNQAAKTPTAFQLTATSTEAMAQNGRPVQHSRSRSGLLVAKEVLDDKLSDSGKVCARPGMFRMQSHA